MLTKLMKFAQFQLDLVLITDNLNFIAIFSFLIKDTSTKEIHNPKFLEIHFSPSLDCENAIFAKYRNAINQTIGNIFENFLAIVEKNECITIL